MKVLHELSQTVKKSLSFLDNHVVNLVLVVMLVLFAAGVVPAVNMAVADVMSNTVVRVLVLFAIMAVAHKNPALAVLFAIAFCLTANMSSTPSQLANVEIVDKGANLDTPQNRALMEGLDGASEEEDDPNLMSQDNQADQTEAMTNYQGNVPDGYNAGYNKCLQSCASGSSAGPECTGVATYNPELNAQGMNCPMGFGGDGYTPF